MKKPRIIKYPPNPQAWRIGMQGATLLTKADQLTRAVKVRASVDLLANSDGDVTNWRDVFDALNMIEGFSRNGQVRNAREFIDSMQQTIVGALDRQKQTGSNVLRPVECDALRDLAATWAQVLATVTCREYFEAEQYVIRKTDNALRAKPSAGVRVMEAV